MRAITIGAVLIGMSLAAGCNPLTIGAGPTVTGSGIAKTESREAEGFDTITFTGVGKVTVEQSGTESLTVTADDNILPLLDTSVTNGTLNLGLKSGSNISTKTPIEFKITVKDLSKVSVTSAGNVEIKQLKIAKLEISLSGVGSVTISGSADSLDLSLSGTGSFEGEKFAVKKATVKCQGVGNGVVNATDSLDVTVSGVGTIEYLGSPNVNQSVSGIGKVKKR